MSVSMTPTWLRARSWHPCRLTGAGQTKWRLLTNRVVTTQEQAVELIDWHRVHWEIEIYFHVLKKRLRSRAATVSSIERRWHCVTGLNDLCIRTRS